MKENPIILPRRRETEIINSTSFIVYPLGLEIMSIISLEHKPDILLGDKREFFKQDMSQLDVILSDEFHENRTPSINWIAGCVGRRLSPIKGVGFRYPILCLPNLPVGDFFDRDPEWQLIEHRIAGEVLAGQLELMKNFFGYEESRLIAAID